MPCRLHRLPNFLRAILLAGIVMLVPGIVVVPVQAANDDDSYDQETIINEATEFFGETTEGLAKAIEHVFEDTLECADHVVVGSIRDFDSVACVA